MWKISRYKALSLNVVINRSSMLPRKYWHFVHLNTSPIKKGEKESTQLSRTVYFKTGEGGGYFTWEY